MTRYSVLLTEVAWDGLELERDILAEGDAEFILPDQSDPATLAAVARERQVDAIMTNWAKVPADVIAASPACRIVARLGVGIDNIDVAYCTKHGIPVTNVPDYCEIEVAEHALALLLALARNVSWHHLETKQGRYDLRSGPPLRRIAGRTLGIVGLGKIGRELASRAQGLGLKVIGTSRREPPAGVRIVELPELLKESDFISLNVPLTPETELLLGPAEFAQMKPGVVIINTARGGLIDQDALSQALASGQVAGAGLDVQTPEPPDLTKPPFSDPRVIVTPHIAFVSAESLHELRTRVCRQVLDRLAGRVPENVVNGVVCDGP